MEDLPLSRTAALVPEFAAKDLPLGCILLWMNTYNNDLLKEALYLRRPLRSQIITVRRQTIDFGWLCWSNGTVLFHVHRIVEGTGTGTESLLCTYWKWRSVIWNLGGCIQGVTGPHRQNYRDDRPCREDHFFWRNICSQTCRLWVMRRWRCSPVRVGIEYKQLYTYIILLKKACFCNTCASLHVWYRRSNDRPTRPSNRSSSSKSLLLMPPNKKIKGL